MLKRTDAAVELCMRTQHTESAGRAAWKNFQAGTRRRLPVGVGTCLTQRKSGKEEELTQDTPNEVRGWSLESREHFLLTRDK